MRPPSYSRLSLSRIKQDLFKTGFKTAGKSVCSVYFFMGVKAPLKRTINTIFLSKKTPPTFNFYEISPKSCFLSSSVKKFVNFFSALIQAWIAQLVAHQLGPWRLWVRILARERVFS